MQMEKSKMSEKFKCSECGKEMDKDCDMCEDCSFADFEEDEFEGDEP